MVLLDRVMSIYAENETDSQIVEAVSQNLPGEPPSRTRQTILSQRM